MREHEGRLVAGRYRLRARLGSGGMGTVWRAVDEFLEREVAVKEVTAVDESDPRFQRTLREARTSARLRHPGVVTMHDVVIEDGRPWLVMEIVDGHSLAEAVERDGPLPERRVADLARQLLAALSVTHGHGILHRDVKPANVLLDGDRAVLVDFGIAAFEDGTVLTATNLLIGSPQYLAPERINGQTAGPPSDLWALGVTLYFAVTGASPFLREDTQSVFAAVLIQEPPPVPGALGPLIAGLLRKDPAERLTIDAAVALLDAALLDTAPEPAYRITPDAPTQPVMPSKPSRLITSGRGRGQLVVALGVVAALAAAVILWVNWPERTGSTATPASGGPTSNAATTEAGVPGSPTFQRMTARGKVVIGVSEQQPGFGYRNPADGSLAGFDIEIATLVAARLGFGLNQVTFTPVPPTGRDELLATGAVDTIVSTYMITDELKQHVGFAGPYLANGLSLLVRRDEPTITGRDSLRGRKVCVARGTTSALELANGDMAQSSSMVLLDSWSKCLDQLRASGVDAVAFHDVTLVGHAAVEPNQLKAISISKATAEYGIGLARDDKALRDKINGILTEALGNGTWRDIYNRTLGRSGAEPNVPEVRPY